MLTIAALYHFTRFSDPAAIRGPLLALCQAQGVKGSLLLATEGVNGTIAGPRAGIDTVVKIQADPDSPHQRSIDVLNSCARADITKVSFTSYGL